MSGFVALLSVDNLPASIVTVSSLIVTCSIVVCFSFLLLLAFLYLHSPELLLSVINQQVNRFSGLQPHTLVLPSSSHTVHYLSGGNPCHPLILLVHGFGMDSSMWSVIASRLIRRGYYVVAPDLVGFGQTTPAEADSYSFTAQVARLKEFSDLVMEGRRFHIGGTSMGGAIAGIYAATHPDDVLSCWLLCPAGIASSHQSAFCERLKQSRTEGNLLLSHTVEDMREVFQHLFHRPPFVPEGVYRAWAKEKAARLPVQRRAMEHITSEGEVMLMGERLKDIKVPVCVAWGQYDQILDVSCVDVIRAKVRAVKPDVLLVESGHAITVEQSRVITRHYLRFLDRLERQNPSSVPEGEARRPALQVKAAADMPEPVGLSVMEATQPSFIMEQLDDYEKETPRAKDAEGLTQRKKAGGQGMETVEEEQSERGQVKVDAKAPNQGRSAAEAAAVQVS